MQLSCLIAACAALAAVDAHTNTGPQQRNRQRDMSPRNIFSDGRIRPYTQQGQYGSCGHLNSDNDHVVAVSYKLQGITWPPAYCGHRLQITHEGADRNEDGSPKDRVIEATVVDTCTTCDSSHLELSVAAFEALAGGTWDNPEPVGRISWKVLEA